LVFIAVARALFAPGSPGAAAVVEGDRRSRGRGRCQQDSAGRLLTLIGFHDTALRILESPAVCIAAVNGTCAGAGLELSLLFDVRIYAYTATFVMPEFSTGLALDLTPPPRPHPIRIRPTVDHDPPTPSRIAT
jgi:enoyl-CoA hydratase/carnithine racemase